MKRPGHRPCRHLGRVHARTQIHAWTHARIYHTKDRYSPEHPDLVHNMVPIPGRLQLVRQQLVELLSHADNPLGHCLDVLLPLFEQPRVIQNKRHLDRVRKYICHKRPRRRPCKTTVVKYSNPSIFEQFPQYEYSPGSPTGRGPCSTPLVCERIPENTSKAFGHSPSGLAPLDRRGKNNAYLHRNRGRGVKQRRGNGRTIRAPCEGGLLISLRWSTDSWLFTLSASSFVMPIT